MMRLLLFMFSLSQQADPGEVPVLRTGETNPPSSVSNVLLRCTNTCLTKFVHVVVGGGVLDYIIF